MMIEVAHQTGQQLGFNKKRTAFRTGATQGELANRLMHTDLVILDELGYLPFSQAGRDQSRRTARPKC